MKNSGISSSFVLGFFIALGLIVFGYELSESFLKAKSLERTVSVKGLAEEYVKADVAIFPITLQVADNDLNYLNTKLKSDLKKTLDFLRSRGFADSEISYTAPVVNDKLANSYGNSNIKLRYSARVTVTVYTKKIDKVLKLQKELLKLNEEGVLIKVDPYNIQYIYTKLNSIKPKMIEKATQNARKAAQKFAKDSHSKLGKIKQAFQGYFSITDRDSNTPYIKKVRVVTNVIYYLDD